MISDSIKNIIEPCKKHIESKLGESLDYQVLEFYAWKHLLGIRDIDLYHRIAQALEVHELLQVHDDNLHYILEIPGNKYDVWTVSISGDNNSEFKEKYGDKYKILK